MTRILAMIGGERAVGTTTLAVQLAACLAAAEQRVCLLELVTDSGAASRRHGLPPVATLDAAPDRPAAGGTDTGTLTAAPPGFDLVTAGGDRDWLRALSGTQLAALGAGLQGLADYDYLLIDIGVCADRNSLAFVLASPELLLVTNPDGASRSAAYALLKRLSAEHYGGAVRIVINKSASHTTGRQAYDKFREIAAFYLDIPLSFGGLIGAVDTPETPSGGAPPLAAPAGDVRKLADRLLAETSGAEAIGPASFGQRLAARAGAQAAAGTPALLLTQAARPGCDDLHEQLAQLSGQITALITEVEQYRRLPSVAPVPAVNARCSLESIAAIASHCETVNVAGEVIPIYHLHTGGRQQRFAIHSRADEEPEPRSRSS